MCYYNKVGSAKSRADQIGVLAQLVARHTGSVEVTGSNPVCSTKNNGIR